jgi:hypothetical protein
MHRAATHAGSWYLSNRDHLAEQLDDWLASTSSEAQSGARVIIAPHAGYAYSGETAAWAYKSLDVTKAQRCFILGPSHHVYLRGIAVSSCASYETPLGPLSVDQQGKSTRPLFV